MIMDAFKFYFQEGRCGVDRVVLQCLRIRCLSLLMGPTGEQAVGRIWGGGGVGGGGERERGGGPINY